MNSFKRFSTYSVDATTGNYSKDTQHLEKIFFSLKERANREVEMSFKICKEIFINELDVKYEDVSYLIQYALPEVLCYYMQIWNGWSEVASTFDEFKSYLISKIAFIIAHQERFCKPAKSIEDLQYLTEQNNANDELYMLVMYGFTVNAKSSFPWADSILQSNEQSWTRLNIQEFINFPNICVSIDTSFLKFSRTSVPDKQQFPDSKFEQKFITPNVEFVEFIKNLCFERPVQVYNIDFIIKQLNQLISLVKVFNRKYKLKRKINIAWELESICDEFIQDLKDVSTEKKSVDFPCTIAYNIGRNYYIRNNKLPKSSTSPNSETSDFIDVIIPKVVCTLTHIRTTQDGGKSHFSLLDLKAVHKMTAEQKQSFVDELNDSISFSCLTCSVVFRGVRSFGEITEHCQSKHRGELPAVCHKCNCTFQFHELLGARWYHKCKAATNNKDTTAMT